MSIPLTGSSTALFDRLGLAGNALLLLNQCQGGTNTTLVDLIAGYSGTDEDLTAYLTLGRDSTLRGIPPRPMSYLTTLTGATVQRMVQQDQPTRGQTLADALAVVVAQMQAASASVQVCTVGATATVYATQTGTGVLVLSTARGDGRQQENLIAEAARVECTADAATGGRPPGSERFQWAGTPNAAGVYDWDWPQGSGATTTVTCADAGTDYSRGTNVLVNGGFDTWNTGLTAPVNWTATGTVTQETTLIYGATGFAVRVAAGATPTLVQTFTAAGVSGNTRYTPPPVSSLAFAVWLRGSAALTGGVLKVELVDGTGAVVNDATGNPASVSLALTGLGTTYTSQTGIVRTPPVIPTTGLQLRLNVSTTPAGGDLLIDYLAVAPLTAAYPGGPGLALFSGATRFVQGDGWNVTATNDRGDSSNLATWQALFDRLFGMRALGLLLPSSGSPTIVDTLITS
ncbi:hypothetical protein [Fimbriiglobus ruber]|uniref:Uncharacterized protein n=1 Tax=Fimbriiglobus ruber TaxID=1908690 RepID=A0A225E8D3_9BACT|nr:hypothetical protein [Fimbriiglobus ruber]OWK45759.1 hypothetical protein FRUB_02090 [Fimbriiglobus ruber]